MGVGFLDTASIVMAVWDMLVKRFCLNVSLCVSTLSFGGFFVLGFDLCKDSGRSKSGDGIRKLLSNNDGSYDEVELAVSLNKMSWRVTRQSSRLDLLQCTNRGYRSDYNINDNCSTTQPCLGD